MPDSNPPTPAPRQTRSPVCARCGSRRIRRSSGHGSWEHLLRRFTPVRFHVCGDCGTRGWHWGVRSPRHASEIDSHDAHRHKPRRRYRHLVRSLVLAVVLGAAAAVYLHQCSGHEAPTPGTIVGG